MWTVLLGCGLLPSAPPEPTPLALSACEQAIDQVAAPEAPSSLEVSAAAGPVVEEATTAVRLPDGLHWLPEPAELGWDEADEPAEIDGGLLSCRLEEGTRPRFRLTVGDHPPIEGASPVPRLLAVAPVRITAGDRLRLEVLEGDDVRARAEARWTPGRDLVLEGRGLRALCRSIGREGVQAAAEGALARLDEVRARACGPVGPGVVEIAELAAALDAEVGHVAALAGWDDPRLQARRPAIDALVAQLREVVQRRVEGVLSEATPPGRRVDLLDWRVEIELTREVSCSRRKPPGHPGGVRCTVEVDVVNRDSRPLRLVGGWNLRLGAATEVALVGRDGLPYPILGTTFRQGGRPVRGEIVGVGEDEDALVELWIDLDAMPAGGGPPLLRLSDGTRTTWLLTRF